MKPLQWFLDRIGKTVYRNSNGCSCAVCERVRSEGLVIDDDFHAIYVYDWYLMSREAGLDLEYEDTKEELP